LLVVVDLYNLKTVAFGDGVCAALSAEVIGLAMGSLFDGNAEQCGVDGLVEVKGNEGVGFYTLFEIRRLGAGECQFDVVAVGEGELGTGLSDATGFTQSLLSMLGGSDYAP